MPRVSKYASAEQKKEARREQARQYRERNKAELAKRAKEKRLEKKREFAKAIKAITGSVPVEYVTERKRGRPTKKTRMAPAPPTSEPFSLLPYDKPMPKPTSRTAPAPPLSQPYNKPMPKPPAAKKTRGRPRKYANADEARKARNKRARDAYLAAKVRFMSAM